MNVLFCAARGDRLYRTWNQNISRTRNEFSASFGNRDRPDKESSKGYSTSGGEPDFVFFLYKSCAVCVQSAAILSKELGLEIRIETDLHEWVANDLYIYEDDHTAEKAYEEYVKNKGIHPDSGCRWEDAATIRRRVLPVLQKYADVPKVIVIGHGMMIEAVTGVPHPNFGEIVPFSLS